MRDDAIRALVDRLEQRLVALVQTVVDFVPISIASDTGAKDFVKVQGDPPDRQRAVRRTSPWGISGRPMTDGVLAGVIKAVGGALGGMIVGVATDKYGPQDLQPGETCIWNKNNGTRIKLDENGKITVDAAPGQDIVFNGGTQKVARVNDLVAPGTTMATWITSVSTALTIGAPTDFGKITTGAANVKG